MDSLFALARRRDPDRAFAAAFVAPEKREAFCALVLFDHELARARAVTREPMLALIRLHWWREAIAAAAAGRPPRHDVAKPLARFLAQGLFDANALAAMVDAREAEAEGTIPSRAAWRAWARGSAGAFSVAAARLLGAPAAWLPAVEQAGALIGLARAVASWPAQQRQGRSLLPEEALAEAGGDRARAAARLAAEALAEMPAVRHSLRSVPRPVLPAVLPLVFARRDLVRAAAGRPPRPARLADDQAALLWAWIRGRV